MQDANRELEELVLKESIVSATGLNARSLQISIRGDPSLRETSFVRKKYRSPVDDVFHQLEPQLQELLLNRSTYRIYVGFNNGEVMTYSVFDPLRMEMHAADRFADPAYIERHFPRISYAEKVQLMRDLYGALIASPAFGYLPKYWRNIFIRRHGSWQPMPECEIATIVSSLRLLRALPEFYLRNVTICTVQDLVRLQFNCDGTHIVSAESYETFLEENLPESGVL